MKRWTGCSRQPEVAFESASPRRPVAHSTAHLICLIRAPPIWGLGRICQEPKNTNAPDLKGARGGFACLRVVAWHAGRQESPKVRVHLCLRYFIGVPSATQILIGRSPLTGLYAVIVLSVGDGLCDQTTDEQEDGCGHRGKPGDEELIHFTHPLLTIPGRSKS